MATLPKSTIQSLGRLVAEMADVKSLNPDTRPQSIRRALRIAVTAGEDKMLLARVVGAAYGLSWDTTQSIMAELSPPAGR